jgi:glycosyltransferase involved in cell wall biosynthesis
MKKLLLIARTCPWPTTDGEKVRVYNIIRQLSSKYQLTLVYRMMFEEERDSRPHLEDFCETVVEPWAPPPRSWVRRLGMVSRAIKDGYPLFVSPHYHMEVMEAVRRVTSFVRFDAVQIEHSFLHPYLSAVPYSKDIAKIITVHNIDFIRLKRISKRMPLNLKRLYFMLVAAHMRRSEIACLNRFDYVVVMSPLETRILANYMVKGRIVEVPNGVDVESIRPIPLGVLERNKTVLFVGSMDYEANKDGVSWFCNAVWPHIRNKHRDVEFWIVGRNPCARIRSFGSHGVVVTGTVDDVMPYYRQARVCIAPLRAGGGTRLKILEAMAHGIPVVTTTLGAEGIALRPGKDALVADEERAFTAGVCRLLENRDLCRTVSVNGRRLVEQAYSWTTAVSAYDSIV